MLKMRFLKQRRSLKNMRRKRKIKDLKRFVGVLHKPKRKGK